MCNIETGLNIVYRKQNNGIGLGIPMYTNQANLDVPKIQGDFPNAYSFMTNNKLQRDYNNEMVRQTWKYQKKYGFEIRNELKKEFWNVESDAFKHTFGSADLYLKYGNVVSKTAGIGHEWEQYKNPPEEWNMDSWNNNQGIEIAKEMIRDYGDSLSTISPEQRNDIIADKVMQRMRSGQLITHPTELRYYKAGVEKNIFSFQRFLEKYGLKKPKGN